MSRSTTNRRQALQSGGEMRNEATLGSWGRRMALAALALAGLAAPVAAADLYRIQGIPVDATAESGVAAREAAIANGQREGLTRLMRRLTSPAAHDRLPGVTAIPIEGYVNSFEIAEEKVGPNQYLGVINVSYIASQVQGLLGSARDPLCHAAVRPDPGGAGDGGGRAARRVVRTQPLARRLVRRHRGRPAGGRGAAAGRSRRHRRSHPGSTGERRSGRARGAGCPLWRHHGDRRHGHRRRSDTGRAGRDRAASRG